MKKKEIQLWRTKSEQELKAQIFQVENELVKLRLELKTGKLKNTRAVSRKRQELAIICTLLREKELGLGQLKEGKSK